MKKMCHDFENKQERVEKCDGLKWGKRKQK